jgi:capsid protein
MMTENLLEAGAVDTPSGDGSESPAVVGQRAARPAGLPDKFWDEKNGQVRLDALVKSYLELERKLGSAGRDIPPGPDHYKVEVKSELLSPDPDVNRRLHAAGFSQEQAQLVYDLACDRLMPMIATFQKVGKGTASTKARHGKVPVMNVDHTPIECTLQDYYAGDWVDQLDELKTNINEQQVVAKAGAFALGRKTDELIIGQLGTSSQFAGLSVDGLGEGLILLENLVGMHPR